MKKSSQIVHGNPTILGTKIFTGSTRFQTDGAVKSESTRLEKSVLVNSWISSGRQMNVKFGCRHDYYTSAPRVGAISDDARLTSVCRVHRAYVENREA